MSLLEALQAKKSGLRTVTTRMRDPLTASAHDNDVSIIIADPQNYQRGIRILCFGASLTRGFIGPSGHEYHPYAIKLAELIREDFKEQPSIRIEIKGVNGEKTHKMAERLKEALQRASEEPYSDAHYDAMILLGGSNDVGDKTPEKTLENLKNMQSTAAKYKIDFFIGTLPSAKADNLDWFVNTKTKINDGIRAMVPESHLIDLAKEIPMHELTEEARDKLWSDHLHLTAAGYDMMAEVIYKKLKVVFKLGQMESSKQCADLED